SDEMMALASAGVFVLRYPNHQITQLYKQVAKTLIA
ncbi:MAG: MinD/ParA family protein, partial [Anaerolineae bacterium]|nr:MinD/ParA family protein [Anaerolineae bacterium]